MELSVIIALVAIVLTAIIGYILQISPKKTEAQSDPAPVEKSKAPAQKGGGKGKKQPQKQVAEKAPHHHLDLNTLKGHADPVTGMAFSFDGRALATSCEDGVIRVFKLEDVSAKSFKFLRLGLPPGVHTATGVAFGEGSGQLLVSATDSRGGCIFMFGPGTGQEADVLRTQGKLPPPEIKWEQRRAHDGKDIATTVSAQASYGTGDGSSIAATCSLDGTDVRVWSVKDGKLISKVDSNQLKNTMAALSPDARFLAIAAFTSDVKVWELVYSKDGSVREVVKVMQLKGHKSAVTWLSFTWDCKKVVTTSKDGTIKMWNIDVRYNVNEDPKCLATFPIPDPPPSVTLRPHTLDRIAVCPGDRILAVTVGPHIQWLDLKTGNVVDTAEHAHDAKILWITWSPKPHQTEQGQSNILATCGADKKLKLWAEPKISS